ncbi:hypothetical protein CEXT_22081 [Caerostris extrusa]|uniref:Uncharacterized protein n=1 Tax=Caerostris extrusa TaxID=172846 RepID=A0AAV4MZ93_CAEEX|nr:hypothetical protein CEXT_22081 [Caerostris extrusa]
MIFMILPLAFTIFEEISGPKYKKRPWKNINCGTTNKSTKTYCRVDQAIKFRGPKMERGYIHFWGNTVSDQDICWKGDGLINWQKTMWTLLIKKKLDVTHRFCWHATIVR